VKEVVHARPPSHVPAVSRVAGEDERALIPSAVPDVSSPRRPTRLPEEGTMHSMVNCALVNPGAGVLLEREGRVVRLHLSTNGKLIGMLDRTLVAVTIALVIVITGVIAIAPPPSDRSKPWAVRSWLFPNNSPAAHPQSGPARAAAPSGTAPASPRTSQVSSSATPAPSTATPIRTVVAPPDTGTPTSLGGAAAGGSATGAAKEVTQPTPTTSETHRPRHTPLVLVSPPTPVGSQAVVRPLRYTVQVGALRDRADADLLVGQLRQDGFDAMVTKDNLYRVHVGQDLDRVAADQLAATLKAAGFDTFVRSY